MFNRATILIVTIVVLHLSLIQSWGNDGSESGSVFGFAESLYEEGDYFRAIGEYKRYIYLAPTDNLAEKATFRIAESYYQAKRWPEAIAACNQFLAKYPASSRYLEMLYLRGRIEKIDRKYDEALQTFGLIVSADAPDYRDKAVYQRALVMLERRDWRGAEETLQRVPRDSPLYPAASAFAAEIEKKELVLAPKSPVTAGLLATVLPGAGHLYAERPRDALVAFLLNGAFIWGALELFQHDNYAAGGILAFFELGWYTGNIYSAVSSVHKYNRDQENDFLQKLKGKFSLALHREEGGSSLILSHRF